MMMDLTMLNVSLMEEIAVGLTLIQIIAQYVNALKEAAIRVGLLTAIAMMSTTMKPVPLMEEIAVDLMSIHNTAQNVSALKTRTQQNCLENENRNKPKYWMHQPKTLFFLILIL